MATLSLYDNYYLDDKDKATILDLKTQWGSASETDRMSINNLANQIRSKYGYDGGVDGTGGEQVITAPKLDPYTSPYQSYLDNSLSQLQNYKSFSYNPEKDPSYQAFLSKATRLGETAFNDNLAGLSAGTGGMENSWAASVASQSRNAYMTQAAEAMPQFEQNAYDRWSDGRNAIINQLNMYQSMDNTAYNRALDSYNAEVTAYKGALDQRSTEIAEAQDRVKLLGYVSNEDAKLLGVPPGTPSYEVQKRTADMEDWIQQQTFQADQLAEELKLRAQYSSKSGGGGGGGSTPEITAGERGGIETMEKNFHKEFTNNPYFKTTSTGVKQGTKIVDGKTVPVTYTRPTTAEERANIMDRYLNAVEQKYETGAITANEYNGLMDYVSRQPEYQEYESYVNRVNTRYDIQY